MIVHGIIDRILTGWFRFTFPDKLTVPWPGFVNDIMKHHFMPTLVRDLYEPSPLMKMLEGR